MKSNWNNIKIFCLFQAQEVIDNIKFLMTEASRELFIATRNRAYYKQVKILLPQTWKNTPFDQPLSGEFYETAEVSFYIKGLYRGGCKTSLF